MMKKIVPVLFVVVAFLGNAIARDLPEFIHVCKRKDPHLSSCMKDSINNLRPYLMKGLPDYRIPTLEPLFLKEMVATAGGNIKLKLKDINIYGASNFTIKRLKANIDDLLFVIELFIPNLAIEGQFEADGRILLLPIKGSGPMAGNFTSCRGIVNLQLGLRKGNDGLNYLKSDEIKVKMAVGTGNLRLQNLFGGDPTLNDAINGAINSNFDAFLQEIQPTLESAISNSFGKIANNILEQFTYDALFPDP